MILYNRFVFPRLMQASLSAPAVTARRKELLSGVQGAVLEIGFGTGLNLPCYPPHIRQIAVVEPNLRVSALAAKRIRDSAITVNNYPLSAERLPFADHTFDSVVSTFTLCSITDVKVALAEIRRVLKPAGRFYFLEHGLSPDAWVRGWQRVLNPFYGCFACGCHVDRDIAGLIEQGRFMILEMRRDYIAGEDKISGYAYQGVAIPIQHGAMVRPAQNFEE